ncbi:MAG TPA: Lrp/AsnC family transcriptional regulator [Flavobacterium sp.]|nr:Lrp/AsnC family transcriptional regulator [Flavobacterium sp.]
MKLDQIDLELLNYLQEDSKQTTKELSVKLGMSVTAVFERIKKLERNEVIQRYVAILDKNKIERAFVVVTLVKIKTHSKEAILEFEKKISELPEVLECFHVSGEYDYVLKISIKDMEDYRDFMISKLTSLDEVSSTQSMFTIKEVKNSTVYKL